ncbi:hypothetical protein ISF_09789 [Cordyceps fumosorosea ARSEF 2679]|uniref:Azaphilone pigments biosynthesis cluster protein L N-terminal domain-containing protein n=1 Tax=Cordyceps fumosorosea (strain ARSEF 2679) TaxID=1081104 RepID=A0A167C8K4_CORFA|nr:hypothetical protein ISF_09789 [Cordyceps fumosorosea ARSEF 2679]OAA40900.1 hypothetical protein ISF_09789 [Cordyceps fumosorosea ARSEF 2679]
MEAFRELSAPLALVAGVDDWPIAIACGCARALNGSLYVYWAMDPLSIIASVLAIVTAGLQSTRSLKAAIQRYKTRDMTLLRLLAEVKDIESILQSLAQLLDATNQQPAVAAETSMTELLCGPIERCTQLCSDFESAMRRFSGKSTSSFTDWARMEFMRGDINQFMDTLAGYKATISVGLGVLNMRTVKLSSAALEELEEMVKDTMYQLNLQLQRINDKMENWPPTGGVDSSATKPAIDLDDERQVTKQCLQICEDAKLYLESLACRDSPLLDQPALGSSAILQQRFEAQLLTRQALNDNQASLVNIITRLRERLETVLTDGDSGERLRLNEDMHASRQCLEVCKLASSEVTNQKIHIIGEVVADGDSDHVVVTTLADLFNVGKTMSNNRSALLVGSMSDDALVQLSHDRYNSRFGALASSSPTIHSRPAAVNSGNPGTSSVGSLAGHHARRKSQHSQRNSPSSNETRRRMVDGDLTHESK